jgi:NAD(P)-dependent dehydrogenase (short-subunit alcohol dehydrogenase family)
MIESGRFEGATALITRAGQGIGRTCVGRLAAEGARVAVSDLDLDMAWSVADSLPESAGRAALRMDVTDRADEDGAVTTAERARSNGAGDNAGHTETGVGHRCSHPAVASRLLLVFRGATDRSRHPGSRSDTASTDVTVVVLRGLASLTSALSVTYARRPAGSDVRSRMSAGRILRIPVRQSLSLVVT